MSLEGFVREQTTALKSQTTRKAIQELSNAFGRLFAGAGLPGGERVCLSRHRGGIPDI